MRDILNTVTNPSMFCGGRRGGKSTMATASYIGLNSSPFVSVDVASGTGDYTATTTWIDEASSITAAQLNHIYDGSRLMVSNGDGTIHWAESPEPEPEPVFDNLGDFLLHKYNKEEKC
jgi:hypothetical protein